ncbi:hypothetical protein [Parabacteroides sp. Marseille-P3160]|uniref:hypothetical protein n=1 Tax=Parabacteroides sp. Marseille-P3160 TaxID=1917887 RepID=UPI0009BC6616|nr:hypothetical protein [Parabacteroides sp. Marseille-P3160]
MIILAESDSSRTEWCLIDEEGVQERIVTDGINPYFQSRKEISHIIRLQLPVAFFKSKASSIYYYGAGCSSDAKKNIVKASLESQLRTPSNVESDLLAAARGLFKDEAGIACIIDTGSNSCFYDGTEIKMNVPPLGYILGDEGSGAALGKSFLSDCLKGIAPEDLTKEFYVKYGIDPDDILDYIYTKSSPNKMLSILSLFLAEHLTDPYVSKLIETNQISFFERNILQYNYRSYPVRFVGKIAMVYGASLRKVAHKYGIQIDAIEENPVDGLIEYHRRSE